MIGLEEACHSSFAKVMRIPLQPAFQAFLINIVLLTFLSSDDLTALEGQLAVAANQREAVHT